VSNIYLLWQNFLGLLAQGRSFTLPNNIRARVTYDSLIVEVFEEEAKKPFIYDLTMGYNYPCGP